MTGTTAGEAVDNGGASIDGGLAGLHVLEAAANDAYVITIEGSATGSFSGEESILATFALDGRALGSELVAIDGPMPRYVRWKATADPAATERARIAVSLIRR